MKAKKVNKKITEPVIKSTNKFPVVGIGASAGGLDAFTKLLKAIPEDSGMAYVLVQHLDPTHESMLPELLQKVTKIPVLEISDDIKVEPDHIYVIPSNKMMVATDGVLVLSPRPPKSKTERNLPIDFFFRSLAEVHQSHAIGVVLSGSATDGTLGLKAIKDHGGITFAQDEASAAYGGMPHSAIQAGVVDFILSPEKIPEKLLEVTSIINGKIGIDQPIALPDEEMFKQILSLLRIRKGTDFTYYKQSTIRRRILRRMVLNKNEEPVDYLKYLRENKPEQDLLFQDMLIPVTSFFRDQKTFSNLSETVFPHIIKDKQRTDPIRIWVAGCSTGEEAYSIAICIREILGGNQYIVQIFATDISEPAIAKARSGVYSKNELTAVSPRRLQDFFSKTNGNYQVNKNVRDMCVFAHHNFLKDPPFGKMDFISCRNVLIYLEPYLQKKALTTFHYSLNPKGYLLLGKSETTGGVPELFTIAAKNDKLFTSKDVPGKFIHEASQRIEQNINQAAANFGTEAIRTDFQKIADDIMLRKYTPAGVVVNEAMDIVHFRGNTGNYLEQSPGKPSHNLLQMAKNGLAFELRNILHKAKKEKVQVIKENIPMELGGGLRNINIEAIPLPNVIEPHYLVLFHDSETAGNGQLASDSYRNGNKKTSGNKIKKDEKDLRINQLEKELALAREDMRSITEDQEAANEELQSANEELLSSSEELQSLNEELETGKEELQSTNEELMVVNQEMIGLNEQLTISSEYAEAIILNIHEPLLVLDKHLRIKTANNAFYKTFRVSEAETEGNLIYNLGNRQWDIPELRTLLEKILPEKSVFNEFKVTHNFSSIGDRVMLLNAREVINKNSSEKLILLSIQDITEKEKAQEILNKSSEQFRHLLKELPAAVYSCDTQGRITFYNDVAAKLWGYKPVIGKDLWHSYVKMLYPNGSPFPLEKAPMSITLKEGRSVKSEEIIFERPDGSRSHVLVHPQPEFDLSGQLSGAINMIFDITDLAFARRDVKKNEELFRKLVETAPVATCLFTGREMKIEVANEIMIRYWGKDKNVIGKRLEDAVPELKGQPFLKILDDVFTTGKTYHANDALAELVVDGVLGTYYFDFTYKPILNDVGEVYGIMDMAVDVTEQVLARTKIEESEKQFRTMAELMPQKIWTSDAEGNKNYFNQTLLDYSGMSIEELKGKGWEKIMHPDDWEKNKKAWVKCLKSGEDYVSENRLLRKDGEFLWHLTRAIALKDKNGKIKIWVGSKTEIQEQRLLKEELERSVERRTEELQQAYQKLEQQNLEIIEAKEKLLTEYSRSLIEASLDPLVTINPEGKITDMNQATLNITGLEVEKLKGSNFFEYFTEPVKAREVYKEVFAKGFVTDSPLTLRHVDGKLTDVFLNGSVYKDAGGKVVGVVLVARDVTEQKRISTELTEAIIFAEMATVIAEEAKLKAEQATQIAEDAVKSKQQFLSNMSHEIRTPMNAIIGFTKVVLKTELTAKQKEYLTAINLSGNSLIVLINDILDLAKVDAGKMSFEEIPFKMSASIAAIMHLFEQRAQEKNIEFVKEYDQNIPVTLLGDPIRLHQIILNLVSNAVKFTSTGKITVSLRLLEVDDEKVSIEFKVIDTGIGIPEKNIDKVFDNFHQATSDTNRLYGGTGLGLAIVKQLVESQGGTIKVKSKINEGSVFSFMLNFKRTNKKAESVIQNLHLDPENRNIKVLVVEDIALNQLLMKTLLDDFGFEQDIAANGKLAIEKLQEKDYDIILMDLQMPEMNGFEATEYIRNTMHLKIPIIALTADVTTVDLEKCRRVGMDDYIAKPVDEALLYSKILSHIKKMVEIKDTTPMENDGALHKLNRFTNLTYLVGITKHDKQLMMEMIALYLEQTPALIHNMKKGMQDKDWEALHAAAHKMTPSFAIMGISKEYETITKRIQEYEGNLSDAAEAAHLVTQLEHACKQACAELEEEYSTLKNSLV